MSRFAKIRFRFRLLSALTAAVLCLVPVLAARAGSYTYGNRQRTVNAGVLFNGSASAVTAMASGEAPYVFYVLNQRTDVKPFGWNIVNPRAPSAVTASIQTRWSGFSPGYFVGQVVTPNMAAYWEVPLSDTSADQLRQYDVLYLPAVAGGSLAPSDLEKLRRFVDSGGQLWVEGGVPNFPEAPGVGVNPGTSRPPALPNPGMTVNGPYLRHPLLSQPFLLSFDDILSLGSPGVGGTLGGNDLFDDTLVYGVGTTQAVSSVQYGAGQIIASGLKIGGAISESVEPSDGPYCGGAPPAVPNFAAASAQNLKFAANLIALSSSHPSENKNGHQNASSADLASFAPAWTFPVAGLPVTPPPPPGAAVWGNFVFVTGADNKLHAFDAYPAEDLTATGAADDGIADFSSPTSPTAYDEIWNAQAPAGNTSDPFVSAPTVIPYNGRTLVLAETSSGKVYSYDAVTGTPFIAAALPNSGVIGSAFSGVAPSPTYFDGCVYAGQPDGTLYVYRLSGVGVSGGAANGVHVPLFTAVAATPEPVTASPAVGLLADGNLTNDIVAYVPTTQNLYTVFLGARADLLQPSPLVSPTSYVVNRGRLRLSNLTIDSELTSSLPRAYDFNGGNPATGSTASPPGFTPAAGFTGGGYYGDYDADLSANTSPSPGSFAVLGSTLNLNQISALSNGGLNNGVTAGGLGLSAPALDRAGDLYYVVNTNNFSYLFGVHDSPQFLNLQIKFRFRLPTAGDSDTDADGVNYAPLDGFQFVGAPVADNQGSVYVAALNAAKKQAAVLCFNATQPVYADFTGAFDPTQATYTQPDELSPGSPNQLQPGPVNGTLRYGQFTATGNRVTFFNFGIRAGGQGQIAGNLSEPQPVIVTPNINGNDPNQQTLQPLTLSLHTNLVWYGIMAVTGSSVSGLSKVGNTLFLSDGANLYQLPANPPLSLNKVATLTLPPAANPNVTVAAVNLSNVSAAPSAGAGVLVVNGTGGIAAFTQQYTMVADNNRILETDSNGDAVWGLDATQQQTGAGVGTRVDFSHPTSLSEVATNDYLVADTGNNRCVRFNRAGDVLWELTHFSDINNLLTAGQPTTLNQPTSVQVRFETTAKGLRTLTTIHYLIADSGNYRVLEVTDQYDNSTGAKTMDHQLTWVSHTGDKYSRRYRYGSAAYFPTPTGLLIGAIVTNTRLAPLGAANALGPASNDSPGGTIVLFNYNSPTSQIIYVFPSFIVPDAAGNATTPIPIRNPRFLTVYQPRSAGSVPSLLYADDNGAFDLVYDSTNNVLATGTYSAGKYVQPTLHFTQADYQATTVPVIGIGSVTYSRAGIPFVPSCVQRLNNDATSPKYLITQTYGQPELGLNTNSIGGEVFEVDSGVAVGGYNGSTLSRPGLTGPLTQPTFAIRPQQ